MIKFLTRVTPGISSQNNLLSTLKMMRSSPEAPPAQDVGSGSKQLLLPTYTPLSLAQPFHPLPHVRHPVWQGRPRMLPPLLWFLPSSSPMALGNKVLEAGAHLLRECAVAVRKSAQI